MNDITPNTPNRQLSLFGRDNPVDYPIAVANKWGFQLSYADENGRRFYHAVEWTLGLGADGRASWSNLKAQLSISNQQLGIRVFPYEASNGKTYQVEYIDEQTCYDVAQKMRVTKTRPQLQEIQEYLAIAGCFINEANKNPQAVGEALLSVAAARREKQINLLDGAGYGNHPRTQLLKERHDGIENLKRLKDAINQVCDHPRYGQIFNAEYQALFGAVADQLMVMLNTKTIRDELDIVQLRALNYGESALQMLLRQYSTMSNEQILKAVDEIMRPIGASLRQICDAIGVHHVTGQKLIGK